MKFEVEVEKHEIDHLFHVTIRHGKIQFVIPLTPEQYEYLKKRLW